jgi:hypothetical protein
MKNKQMQEAWMNGKQAVVRSGFEGGVNLIVCAAGTNDSPYGVVLDREETHDLIRDLIKHVGLPSDVAEEIVR